MDLQSKNNAREALNNLKMEISSELGYYYNMRIYGNNWITVIIFIFIFIDF